MIWISTQVRRPSKMGKIMFLDIILGDKQTHSNNNNASYIFNVRVWSLHNQNKIFWATAESGKALLPFSGWSIVSRADAWVFLVSQRDTRMPAQTETLDSIFQEATQSISQHYQELCSTPLTCTTTTWMDTWSGSLIGARKYCDNATRRWSIATRLLAWTAETDIKSTSNKLQSN